MAGLWTKIGEVDMEKYVIGLDFGTMSARGMLVRTSDGKVLKNAVSEYAHGVISNVFLNGKKLEPDFALQHPQDYLDALSSIFSTLLNGVKPDDVEGIGVDFTQCTMMPVTKEGIPLCFLDKYKNEPHAYVKLWKHHGAAEEAQQLTQVAQKRGEAFLQYYGGRISSEFMFPKILEILHKTPAIYQEADGFVELADWITWHLTGQKKRSCSIAAVASFWDEIHGYPSKEYFGALDDKFANVVEEKLSGDLVPLGLKIGTVSKEAAKRYGLSEQTIVTPGIGDSHAAFIGSGLYEEGSVLMVIGTSGCDIMIHKEGIPVTGFCGICKGSVLPGFYGYEAGQACIGDHFQWAIDQIVPSHYYEEAKKQNRNIYDYMNQLAANIYPGSSGILALDWWNGNRSVLMNAHLSGMLLGMNLNTKCEHIYAALVEAVAFGKKRILEVLEEQGLSAGTIYATGGIAANSPYAVQVMADILGKTIVVPNITNGSCMGSALYAIQAVRAEQKRYETFQELIENLPKQTCKEFHPRKEMSQIYEKLYSMYKRMYQLFGTQETIMEELHDLKLEFALKEDKNEIWSNFT